jgi:hypothetical protein
MDTFECITTNQIILESPQSLHHLILVVCSYEIWIHYCGVPNTRSVNATNLQRKCNQLSTTTFMNKVYYIQEND